MTKGIEVKVHIDQKPRPGDVCERCGADSSHYVKHAELHGGRCSGCGNVWLPGLEFSPPKEFEVEIEVERTPDGGAILYFKESEDA